MYSIQKCQSTLNHLKCIKIILKIRIFKTELNNKTKIPTRFSSSIWKLQRFLLIVFHRKQINISTPFFKNST